jgi:heme A synthase
MTEPKRIRRWYWVLFALGGMWIALGIFELMISTDPLARFGFLGLGVATVLFWGMYLFVTRRPSDAAIQRADRNLDARE